MKKIKKSLLAFLVLSFVFIAGGCSLNNDKDNNNGTTTATTTNNNNGNNNGTTSNVGTDIKKGVDNVEDSITSTTK